MSLKARLRRLEERRGLAEAQPWERPCPSCGEMIGRIIFKDATKDPATYEPSKPCEMCERLRAELPPRAPINLIEFRDNTSSREEIERQRAIREEFEIDGSR